MRPRSNRTDSNGWASRQGKFFNAKCLIHSHATYFSRLFFSTTINLQIKRERRTSEQPTTTALEKLRRELETEKCREMERLQAEHAIEVRQLTDRHLQLVSDIKKKQWVIFFRPFDLSFQIYSVLLKVYYIYFSVTIARLRRYIIVVGIPRIAVQIANRFIGNVNIKEYAGVNVNLRDERAMSTII